jgi:hypothetical protein
MSALIPAIIELILKRSRSGGGGAAGGAAKEKMSDEERGEKYAMDQIGKGNVAMGSEGKTPPLPKITPFAERMKKYGM